MISLKKKSVITPILCLECTVSLCVPCRPQAYIQVLEICILMVNAKKNCFPKHNVILTSNVISPFSLGTKAGGNANSGHHEPTAVCIVAALHPNCSSISHTDSCTPRCRTDTSAGLSICLLSLCLLWWYPNLALGVFTVHGVTANALEVTGRATSNTAPFPAVKRSMRKVHNCRCWAWRADGGLQSQNTSELWT